jgi:hypothetical protein
MSSANRTTFKLLNRPGFVAPGTDVLGLWRASTSTASIAFASSPSVTQEIPIWDIGLPADRMQAATLLVSCDAIVQAASRRLADVTTQLSAILDRYLADVAFSGEDSTPGATAEAELIWWLSQADEVCAPALHRNNRQVEWLERSSEALRALSFRLVPSCAPSAWVETRIDGDIMARSLLHMAGISDTLCRRGLSQRTVRLHQDSVRLVVESRAVLLNAVACTVRGAVAISMRLTMPGGPILALPILWRFVHRMLSEVDRGRPTLRTGRHP